MHARYYSPVMGRFLAVDPVDSARLVQPGSWNKYVYGGGNPLKYLDPDGLAVQAYTLLTEGPNHVPIRGIPDVLGLEQTSNGFHLNTNVRIEFSEGDDLSVYEIERDAFTLAPQQVHRTCPVENPDDPGHLSRTGNSIFVYDGPGITVSRGGTPVPRRAMGSGNYISFYQIRVLNKDTKSYDPKRFYFAISVTYENGEAVSYAVKEVTMEEYQEYLGSIEE